MKISLACDHGGYTLKEEVKAYLLELGHEVIDCGTNSLDSCNYPEFAHKAAHEVSTNNCPRGIVICTTGEGVCMCANKAKGVRCALVYNEEVCHLTREHNDANMIAFGAKYTSVELAKRYVDIFLSTEFAGGRHVARVNMIEE